MPHTTRSFRSRWTRSRLLVSLAAGAVLATTLVACGGSSGGGSSSGGDFKLRLSSDVPATSAAGIGDALFAKKVSELTGGHVKIQVYPLSQLGTEATVLSGIQTGSIDIADVYTGAVTGQLPTLGLYSLPFLIRSEAGAAALLNDSVTSDVLGSLSSKGIKGLYVASNGPFEVLAKKAVHSPGDLSGLKLRINTDPISTAMLKAVDATAVPLPSLQVYSALQQGLVSGGITAPAGMVALKWFEVAKQLSELEPQWDAQATLMSAKTWNRLPSKYQKAITQAAAATMTDNKTTAGTATAANLDILKKGGVTFTSPDKAAFRAIETPVYKKFESSIGADVIAKATAVESGF